MKSPPPGTAEKIAKMTMASIYPMLIAKVEKKGRTREELNEVIVEAFSGHPTASIHSATLQMVNSVWSHNSE